MAKKEDIGMIKQQIQALNQKLRDVQEQTGEYIAENPFKSTLISFGAGVLAGAVLMKLLERK